MGFGMFAMYIMCVTAQLWILEAVLRSGITSCAMHLHNTRHNARPRCLSAVMPTHTAQLSKGSIRRLCRARSKLTWHTTTDGGGPTLWACHVHNMKDRLIKTHARGDCHDDSVSLPTLPPPASASLA